MITIFVEMHVKPGMEQQFNAAVGVVKQAFEQAEGSQGFVLHRSVDDHEHYILRVAWADLAACKDVFHKTSTYHAMIDALEKCLASELKRTYTETVTSTGQFRRFEDMDQVPADKHF